MAVQLAESIARHRANGRSALLADDLDRAFAELWAARELEVELLHLGPVAARALPPGWEMDTDLVPLARALASRAHERAPLVWRAVLEDGAPRSVQAEAAEWLAREAFGRGEPLLALRMLHVGSALGRRVEAVALRESYRQAGLDPSAAFAFYLVAVRLDAPSARSARLHDPLTGLGWPDQDPAWWRQGLTEAELLPPRRIAPRGEASDHQREALERASDLAHGSRDRGWLLLAEGDYAAGPSGARVLGRSLRAGYGDAADHDLFHRVRLAYEGAADRLPDTAWPWYRLAELLAWAGFSDRAVEHLAQAERRTLGDQASERTQRPLLRALVQAGLGTLPDGTPVSPRPFPAAPHGPHSRWRLRLLPGG